MTTLERILESLQAKKLAAGVARLGKTVGVEQKSIAGGQMHVRVVKARGVEHAQHLRPSDIPRFAYQLLWEERQLVSVANLTRQDGIDFLRLVPEIGIITKTTTYPLERANQALADLRAGRFEGAAVLVP